MTVKTFGISQLIAIEVLEVVGLDVVRATRDNMHRSLRRHVTRFGSDPDTDELRAPRFTMQKYTEPAMRYRNEDGSVYREYPELTVIVCRLSGRYRVRDDA